jgi:hypothetical protein
VSGAGAALTTAVLARDTGPTRALSSCTLSGDTVWWLMAGSPSVYVSAAGSVGALPLPPAPWPPSARPVACAVSGGALVVGVANATAGGSGVALYTASALPDAAASPTWTAIAAFPGGSSLAGFALSSSGLTAYLAVRGVGVVEGTRAAAGTAAFGAFTVNAASAASASASAVVDVLLSATERALYVLTDGALSVADLAAVAAGGGTWAGAPLAAVASAGAGARYAGLALSQ